MTYMSLHVLSPAARLLRLDLHLRWAILAWMALAQLGEEGRPLQGRVAL